MDVISIEQTDSLLWLGRYAERVYSCILDFSHAYDAMIDGVFDYRGYCYHMGIPCCYDSQEDFKKNYCMNELNPDSLISNLIRAYDNAIVLREQIGSEALSFIQMALYDLEEARESEAPVLQFRRVMDHLMGFWGVSDDRILDENVRNILKVGKRIERIDLYARLEKPQEDMIREISRLTGRIDRCNLKYDRKKLSLLNILSTEEDMNYPKIMQIVETLLV